MSSSISSRLHPHAAEHPLKTRLSRSLHHITPFLDESPQTVDPNEYKHHNPSPDSNRTATDEFQDLFPATFRPIAPDPDE